MNSSVELLNRKTGDAVEVAGFDCSVEMQESEVAIYFGS